MEMSGQLHTLVALTSWKVSRVLIGWEVAGFIVIIANSCGRTPGKVATNCYGS
jgi:hypothetical protein